MFLAKNSRGLGISICGGSDQDYDYSCKGEFVRIKKLFPLQPALESGKLQVGDIILSVNGTLLKGFKQNVSVGGRKKCRRTRMDALVLQCNLLVFERLTSEFVDYHEFPIPEVNS